MMATMNCPDAGRLARAVSVADDAIEAHALDCPRCGAALDESRALVSLARAMPAPAMTAARRRQLADAVQVAAEAADATPPPSRWARYLVAGVLGMAAGGAIWLSLHGPDRSPVTARVVPAPAPVPPPPVLPEPPPSDAQHLAVSAAGDEARAPAPVGSRASVVALADADFERVEAADEDRLVLRGGAIVVDGGDAPERDVRIVTAGATVHGRGARFEAHGDHRGLRVVRVFAGSVEIAAGARRIVVSHGETWTWEAPPEPPPRTPTQARVVAPEPAVATAPEPSEFQRGWALLRAGEFVDAALALDEARDEPGVEEDATYWAAVAWARAGKTGRARRGFEAFLDDFAASPRAGEAHLALAKILIEDGDADAAQDHIDAAKRDDDPRVRAAADALIPKP